MSYETYKTLHILGLILLFIGFGALWAPALDRGNAEPAPKGAARRFGIISHGLGMLLLIVAGFGMLAKAQLGFPAWLHPKLLIWVLFGALVMVPAHLPALARPMWVVLPLLGVIAGGLAIFKPF